MSSKINFLRSPKSGALTATTFNIPRILFTIRVANASPSISSAMINNVLLCCDTLSKIGNNSFMLLNLRSAIKINGFSNVAVISLLLVTKYGDL